MKSLISIVSFLCCCQTCLAQDHSEEEEKLSSFNYYYQNPININTATEAEWNSLAILNQQQIDDFFQHRNQLKEFLSIYELQVIPSFDITTLQKIKPFIQCLPLKNRLLASNQSSNKLLFRTDVTLEQKKGFSPPDTRSKVRYLGNPFGQLMRYRGKLNGQVKYGFLSQKDAGEINYTDFYSAFLEIKPNKFVEKIILGDYLNQWGQGLIESGGFSLGKSYESIKATQRFHLGGIPYSSAGENGFYRGIHTTWRLSKSIQFQHYYSSRKIDASISKDSLGNAIYKTLDADGYHRTESEIGKKENLGEESQGGSLQFLSLKKALSLQLNYNETTYSLPKLPSSLDYKKWEWSGQNLQNSSLSMQFPWRNVQMMGEIALTWPKSISLIQGAAFSLSKKVDFSYVARMYSPSFYSPKSQAFGEGSGTANEYGLFIGNQLQLNKRSKLSSYLDVFTFPRIKYQLSKENSWGWELLSRYHWERRNKLRFFSQIKWTSKESDAPKPNNKIVRNQQIQLSLDVQKIISKSFHLHSRWMLHYLGSELSSELGLLLIQDVSYQVKQWEFNTRMAYFNSPSYDTRLYAYEMGVPFAFSLPAHAGKGIRYIFVIENHLHAKISLAFKVSRSTYFDREEIGSSYDLINGNHKTDVLAQVVFGF